MATVVNPFDRCDLYLSAEHHAVIDEAVNRSDSSRPFARFVDAWWLALCIGIQAERRVPLDNGARKIIDGTIFGSDPWRITHLQLLGLNWFGADAMDEPSRVITTANEYANGGVEWIVEAVVGQPNRTLAVLSRIEELLN